MNQDILNHQAWVAQTKLCYGYDSSMFISTTKLSDRHMSCFRRCNALKSIIKKNVPNVKVVNASGYYTTSSSTRIYFNINDTLAIDFLMRVVNKNTNIFETIEIKSPRDEAHLHLLNNKEITQIIRKTLYYKKYTYSVKLILAADDIRLSPNSGSWSQRNTLRSRRTTEMRKWIDNNMSDNMNSLWYDEIQLYTNDVSALMLFRLAFDVKTCTIKEAIVIEEVDKKPYDELEIMI